MVPSSPEMQRRLILTKVYCRFFYYVWNKTIHKPSKVVTSKKNFFSMYVIGTICYDECLLSHVIPGRYWYWSFFQPPCFRYLWNRWFERRPYFILYLSNNIELLKHKFPNEALTYHTFVFWCSVFFSRNQMFFQTFKTGLEVYFLLTRFWCFCIYFI